MADASRSLIALVVVAFVLVAMWLLVGQPAPPAPKRSQTPFAPVQAIQQAEDVSAASDAVNAQRQAAADQVDAAP